MNRALSWGVVVLAALGGCGGGKGGSVTTTDTGTAADSSGDGGFQRPPGPPVGSDDAASGSDTSGSDAIASLDLRDGQLPPVVGTFVSSATGNDGNPGTRTAPVKTIARGMQIARGLLTSGLQTVFVAQGHYAEKIVLVEGMSLMGGHECNAAACTWMRDPKAFDTAIDNIDDEGVFAPAATTRKTRIDGFRVRGRSGGPSAIGSIAITIAGSPAVENNTIEAGVASGGSGRSIGIDIIAPITDPAGPLITGNLITGATAAVLSAGVVFGARVGAAANATTVGTVAGNVIRGGAAPSTFGIFASTSRAGTLVKTNFILAGGSTNTSGSGSWGIQVGSRMTIDANRINDLVNTGACTAPSWCGGIASSSATVTITNNIVYGTKGPRTTALFLTEAEAPAGVAVVNGNTLDGGGGGAGVAGATTSAAVALRIGLCNTCGLTGFVGRLRNNIFLGGTNANRYGVYEETTMGKAIHTEVLDHNDFFFPGAARLDNLYRFWNGSAEAKYSTLAQLAKVPTRTSPPANNLAVDPLLDATLHLSRNPPSPLVDKGTAVEAPARDFEDQMRPLGGGIDIGHDEAQ